MNLALSDEQVLLREAARGALSRFKTLEEAREALDSGGSTGDLWPTAKEAGWPGLLIDESHGGAGLDVFDAMLVLGECGRALAAVPLLGHLPATAILNDSPGGLGVRRCSASWQAGSAARPTWRHARRMTSPSGGASTPQAGWSAPRSRAPSAAGRARHG